MPIAWRHNYKYMHAFMHLLRDLSKYNVSNTRWKYILQKIQMRGECTKNKKTIRCQYRHNVEMSLEHKLCQTNYCTHNYVSSNLHCITLIFNTVPLVQSRIKVIHYTYMKVT